MARIFLSYASPDESLAKEFELRLKSKGHEFTSDVGALPVGKWREKLQHALKLADVIIPLLSQRGLASNFVSSEIGAARVYDEIKGVLLLPVIIGDYLTLPSFVSDYHCYYLAQQDPDELDRLVDNICKAIDQHIADIPKTPKIFISHRHKDEAIAEALVELLEAAFYIEKEDIRCTSVQPYTLPSGEKTSDKLRAEISNAEVVLGIITPDTTESKYVIAELGAAWGCNISTFPLLARDATYEHVPEPLSERHSLSLQKDPDCSQLIDDVARATTLRRKTEVSGRVTKNIKHLCSISSEK